MAALEESSSNLFMIDEAYEFSAPRFYDFICGETDEDVRNAELWFDNAPPLCPFSCTDQNSAIYGAVFDLDIENLNLSLSFHESSAFMPRIKATRNIQLQILCNFGEDEQTQKGPEPLKEASNSAEESAPKSLKETIPEAEIISAETTEEVRTCVMPQAEVVGPDETKKNISLNILNENSETEKTVNAGGGACSEETGNLVGENASSSSQPMEAVRAMNSKNRLQKSQVNNNKPASVRRDTNVKSIVGTPNFAHENHAIKRQKLEGGKSRQILTVNKPWNPPHKTRTGIISSSSNFCSSTAKTCKEDRKNVCPKPAAPFVLWAEMMRKFQSGYERGVFPSHQFPFRRERVLLLEQRDRGSLSLH
ncbi:protein TPX2 [Sesamum alatum]|uniref:Protein TPX2 n=1 Tax=Sesamum alatum TaxID=300844 RepID=A0AAE1YXT3_9LAMI|nr:protein TPX2 [Sesamum alatum]